jgi:hypothetical protein
VRRSGPARRLTSTERGERYGVRASEASNRAARVERMLGVLDSMWREMGRNPLVEARRTIDRLREYTPEQWHWLAKCADPAKVDEVKPPSEQTRAALLGRLELRERDAEASKVAVVPRLYECSICGVINCHRESCAEECGIRGLPREVMS